MRWLEATKRVVVILAAVAAFFPISQWYFEASDRRLDRVANLVQAISVCYDFAERALREKREGLTGETSEDYPMRWVLPLDHVNSLCNEVMESVLNDPAAARGVSETVQWLELLKRRFDFRVPDRPLGTNE